MEEDVEIDLLLKSTEAILEEAANSVGTEVNSESDEIDEPYVQTANGLELSTDTPYDSASEALKRKQTWDSNEAEVSVKKRKITDDVCNNEYPKNVPLDDLQQELDNHTISLISNEPHKHVFTQSFDSSSDSSDSEYDISINDSSKDFINEFTADDELPYGGTFVDEIRRQVGDKGKKQHKGIVIKELNNAQRLLLKRDALLTKLEVELQEKISINKEKQNEVHEKISLLSVNEKSNIRQPSFTRNFFRSFGIPYFEDNKGFTSAPNEDMLKKMANNELNLLSIPKVNYWSKLHNTMLVDCITDTLREEKIERLTKEIFKLKDTLKHDKIEEDEEVKTERLTKEIIKLEDTLKHNKIEEDVLSKIENLQKELTDVKKVSFNKLISKENPNREYDWMKYSVKRFNGIHSPEECRRFWHTYLKPAINKSKWTAEEDLKLVELVEQMHGQDWDNIARLLGTNRSAYQCFIHYQTRIEVKHQYSSGKWTNDEDDNLMRIIKMSRHGDFIPWTKVAAHFPNRSHAQVYSRWTNCLNPKLVKGRFTKEEDVLIVAGIEVFGATCQELSSLMENRSGYQIRDRYDRHLLLKTANIGTWTLEEDARLLELVGIHGRNWVSVSKNLGTRSRTQVRQRYNTIQHMMKIKPGWNIEMSQRKYHPNDFGKSVKKTWRIVEKLRREIDEIEQCFSLTNLEKETFRIEKLKELKDLVMIKKCYTTPKKKTIKENSELNKRIIEYFKPSYAQTFVKPNFTRLRDKKDSQAHLNLMLMTVRHLGWCEVELPKTKKEIASNPRLSSDLKIILADTIREKGKDDVQSEGSSNALDSTTSQENIDYIPPLIDDSIVMNKWWFCPPINISLLNFSEFFKRTVFDYSSGMHEDIWYSRVTSAHTNHSKHTPPKHVVSKQQSNRSVTYFTTPPNSLNTLGLRSYNLSKLRLQRITSVKGLSRFLNLEPSFQGSANEHSIQPDALTTEQQPDALTTEQLPDALTTEQQPDALTTEQQPDALTTEQQPDALTTEQSESVNDSVLNRNSLENPQLCKMNSDAQQTVIRLFYFARILSVLDIDATPLTKQYTYRNPTSEGKVAANKVLSLINNSKDFSAKVPLELKEPYYKACHDVGGNVMENVYERNLEVKRKELAHKRGNKCLRKMKIEELLKKKPKKEASPKVGKVRKSKNGLCPDQRVIYKRLKKIELKSEPVQDIDIKNNENLSVKVPASTYKRKKISDTPLCTTTQEWTDQSNVENEILIRHEGVTVFKGTISTTANQIGATLSDGAEMKENQDISLAKES